jgi:hypothetical protein
MEFQEWFCLKGRDAFTIDPKINPEDAKFYFGREMEKSRMLKQLKRAFVEPGVPKVLIFGPYGSGKTQSLFFIDYTLRTNKPDTCKLLPHTVRLELEMRKKSDFRNWHLQIMEALGRDKVIKWLEQLSSIGAGFEKGISEVFANETNMIETAKKLLLGGEMSFLAWKWLCGYRLTGRELESLRVTRNLGDIGVGDTVNLLISLGKLSAKNEEKLIFLMDEAEQFRNVADADAMSDLHDYLRKLADKSNSSAGFIISFQAVTLDDMPGWFHQEDILGRVGRDNIIDIPHLPAVKEVQVFMKEMLAEFIEKDLADKKIKEEKIGVSIETYPFKADAFDLLAEYATQDPEKTLPRNIIRAINECAITAWDKELPIIETDIVDEIAPLIFG